MSKILIPRAVAVSIRRPSMPRRLPAPPADARALLGLKGAERRAIR